MDERMVYQFSHAQPFFRVLMQTFKDKTLRFIAQRVSLRKVDVLIYNFDQILLSSDLKRHPSIQQFIGQYAYNRR